MFILGGMDWFPVWAASVICILLLVGAVACSLTTDIAREEAERIETKQAQTTARIMAMRTLSAGLPALAEDAALKKALMELAEDFRFSAPVSVDATAAVEKELESKLREVSGKLTSGSVTPAEVQTIRKLLAQRNVMCKAGKQ